MNTKIKKELCYHCGGSALKKQRNWPSPHYAGVHDTKICLPYHLVHVSIPFLVYYLFHESNILEPLYNTSNHSMIWDRTPFKLLYIYIYIYIYIHINPINSV